MVHLHKPNHPHASRAELYVSEAHAPDVLGWFNQVGGGQILSAEFLADVATLRRGLLSQGHVTETLTGGVQDVNAMLGQAAWGQPGWTFSETNYDPTFWAGPRYFHYSYWFDAPGQFSQVLTQLIEVNPLFTVGGVVDPTAYAQVDVATGAGGALLREALQFTVGNDAASQATWGTTDLPELKQMFASLRNEGSVQTSSVQLANGQTDTTFTFTENPANAAQTLDVPDSLTVDVIAR